MTQTDYPELEGNKVDYLGLDEGDLVGKVVGFDYDIGITIVDVNDKNNYLLCINGPNSPLGKANKNLVKYKRIFYAIVGLIEKGKMHIDEVEDIISDPGEYPSSPFQSQPSSKSCAFNQ
jgi:hypothetical protein